MTMPVNSPLQPTLVGRQLSVDAALKAPTLIANRIAKLADSAILLPHIFRQYGAKVDGGALLYNSLQSSDYYLSTNIEARAPGAEYQVVEGSLPEPQLALVSDYGFQATIPIEAVLRNNISILDNATIQGTNTLTRKLDELAIAAVEAAEPASIAVSLPWDQAITVGALTDLTPSNQLPTAAFAAAQTLADRDELGVQLDTLLVAPEQAQALKTLYGFHLDDALKSAGLTMHSNARLERRHSLHSASPGARGHRL